MYFCTTNYITEISLRATQMYLCATNYITEISESYKCTSVQPTTSQKSVWELHMYLCTTNYITEISLRATHVPLYNQLHHRNQSESYTCTSVQPTTSQKLDWELQMYFCTTNYITEISLRATNVPLYNQLHHRNQSESYTCTSVQPTTSQKSVWELNVPLCNQLHHRNRPRATNVLLYNQLHHRNQSESYKCTSVQPTTSQKSVWELQMYLCITNYITEISLRATNVPLYNQLHHRNQSESYKCTSVQPTTSQKSVWELQMYLCTTNYITEISLRATNVPLYNQLHHRNQSELQMYLCITNYITEISLRATNVPLYNQLHHRNQSESYKCTSV